MAGVLHRWFRSDNLFIRRETIFKLESIVKFSIVSITYLCKCILQKRAIAMSDKALCDTTQ